MREDVFLITISFTGCAIPVRNKVLFSAIMQTVAFELESISILTTEAMREFDIGKNIQSIFISRQKCTFASREIDHIFAQITFE